MPQSETVCQFCGVSYLIHHEIKKLEEKITFLEKQLVGYNDMKNQKNDLNQKIDKNQNEISQLKQSLYESKSLLVMIISFLVKINFNNDVFSET